MHPDLTALISAWPIRWSHPGLLVLLAALPLVAAWARRSLAGLGPTRGPAAVVLRIAVVTLLVLALAGPEWRRTCDDQTAVFLVDQSRSVSPALQRAATRFVQQAVAGMRPDRDRAGVVSFAGEPVVEQLPAAELHAGPMAANPQPQATSLAAALRMGLALLPPEMARRVVLLSDGNETLGAALAEARTYAAAGVPIDVAPLAYRHAHEIVVERLTAPGTALPDERVALQLVVRATSPARARVRLYENDRPVAADVAGGTLLELEAGANRFTLSVALHGGGLHNFRAELQPERAADDTLPNNNEGRAFTIAGPLARVLLLAEAADAAADLLGDTLRTAGLTCDRSAPGERALDPVSLSDYALVILSNVPAFALGDARLQGLASYVRDFGGGLIAIGGDNAFTLGGYDHTPLGEVLPVETNRAQLQFLSLAMVIVLDCSGSMAGEKIDMARQAAIAAVDWLSTRDRLGVIAFSGAADWVVALAQHDNKAPVRTRLSTIGAAGGTVMGPALEQAYRALVAEQTNLKHIIVLTDGQSQPADFDGLARACAAQGITISAVAVGPDADDVLLGGLATRTQGRLYRTDSAKPLPQIFARETVLASRTGLYEQPFTPTLRPAPGESVLSGLSAGEIPPLRGHVITAAKPAAQTPLVRQHKEGTDPILAYWQVGLGRTVAFTSGMWSKWGPDWAAWPGFAKLWTQCVRYAARENSDHTFDATTYVEGETARLVLEATDLSAAALATVSVAGQVVDPAFSAHPLKLSQTGPGRFEATYPVTESGTYLANVVYHYGHGATAVRGSLRSGAIVICPAEYRALADNTTLLSELARATGGRLLQPDQARQVYEMASIHPVETRRPFWDLLVRWAVVLFVADVAVRRIALDPAAVAKKLRALASGSRLPVVAGAVQTLATLRGVRTRMRAEPSAAGDTPRTAVRPGVGCATSREAQDALTPVEPDANSASAASNAPPASAADAATEHTSRLLQTKRDLRRKQQSSEQD